MAVNVAAVAVVVCTVVAAALYAEGIRTGDRNRTYVQSQYFGKQVYRSAGTIMEGVRNKRGFGRADVDSSAMVDLQEVLDGGEITYENTSGLAYPLKDLEEWAKSGWGFANDVSYGSKGILICEKPDGTYDYCTYGELSEKIMNGELEYTVSESAIGELGSNEKQVIDSAVSYMERGYLEGSLGIANLGIEAIVDADRKVQYVNVYNYTGDAVAEKYAPAGASDILEVLNSNPKWNGRIDEAFQALGQALETVALFQSGEHQLDKYTEGNSNLTYLYADMDDRKIYSNDSSYKSYADREDYLEELKADGGYVIIRDKLSECETDLEGVNNPSGLGDKFDLQEWQHMAVTRSAAADFVFAVQVDTMFPVEDDLAQSRQIYDIWSPLFVWMAAGAVLALIVFLTGFVWLTVVAGRRPEDEAVHLCAFDRWFTELAAALTVGVWLVGLAVLRRGFVFGSVSVTSRKGLVLGVLAAIYTMVLLFAGYLSLVRRIKAGNLWKNSFLRWFLGWAKRVLKKTGEFFGIYFNNTSEKIKVSVFLVGFVIFQLVMFMFIMLLGMIIFLPVLLVADAAVFVYFIRKADARDKILEGLRRISGGELQYKIPAENLKGQQKTMAEYINNIGAGLDAAVENSLKNERMKTELITNVSHDIKTPLTSIINYVDLLKRENFTDPKICGYLEVLEEKAQRLKVLTEDVVEASKASTGNISLEMTKLDFVEMLHQVIGEFQEKFGEKNLAMIVQFADEPSMICADGQRLWRVLENIFNNVVKYAMEGTRVYAEVQNDSKKVTFSLKNISAQPLNISADELTERFIRGDVARNTDGSGLGLSIAKSLTELQGGEFKLYLDGDLFKVTITFAASRPGDERKGQK